MIATATSPDRAPSLLLGEQPHLSLAEVAKRSGKSRHTIKKWLRMPGVRGIVLQSVMVGGRRHVTLDALARFEQRLNEHNATPEPTTLRTETQRQRDIARADETLARAGW